VTYKPSASLSILAGLPSREILRAEREQVKVETTRTQMLIGKSREAIKEMEERFADSFERLAESQKLIRPDDNRFARRP
jgi:ribosomal protein S3